MTGTYGFSTNSAEAFQNEYWNSGNTGFRKALNFEKHSLSHYIRLQVNRYSIIGWFLWLVCISMAV